MSTTRFLDRQASTKHCDRQAPASQVGGEFRQFDRSPTDPTCSAFTGVQNFALNTVVCLRQEQADPKSTLDMCR